MDFNKIVDQVKGKAEDLKEKAEAKIKETRENLDKDHDDVPDALERLGREGEDAGGRGERQSERIWQDRPRGSSSRRAAKMGEMADQAKVKLTRTKGGCR